MPAIPKLTLAPDQTGYAVSYGNDTVYVRNDGPAGIQSRRFFNNANIVDVTWLCSKEEYDYLAACHRATLRHSTVFNIDLLLDDIEALTEYKAQFVPGTFKLSVKGETFTVNAKLEIQPLPYDVVNNPFVVDSGLADLRLRAVTGYYELSGQSVTLRGPAVIKASVGFYAIEGQSIELLKAQSLLAAFGAFVISGQAANFLRSGLRITANNGSYAIAGQSVRLIGSHTNFVAAKGNYSLSGQAVGFTYNSLGDPYYANVILLLLMQGSNGSTTFTENSPSAKTIQNNGSATISTADATYPSGVGVFNGTNQYLSALYHSDFNLGGSDFTMETRIKFSALPSSGAVFDLFDHWRSGTVTSLNFLAYLYNASGTLSLNFSYSTTGTNQINLGGATWAPSTSVWYHVAFVRSGNNFYYFVDGVQIGSTQTISGSLASATLANVQIAANFANSVQYYTNAKFRDYRITKGVARYTSTFTPPASPLPTH